MVELCGFKKYVDLCRNLNSKSSFLQIFAPKCSLVSTELIIFKTFSLSCCFQKNPSLIMNLCIFFAHLYFPCRYIDPKPFIDCMGLDAAYQQVMFCYYACCIEASKCYWCQLLFSICQKVNNSVALLVGCSRILQIVHVIAGRTTSSTRKSHCKELGARTLQRRVQLRNTVRTSVTLFSQLVELIQECSLKCVTMFPIYEIYFMANC